MQEDNGHIDPYQLIPKYLSGNASDPEVKLLEDWVLSSPENKARFNAFKKAWILSGVEGNARNIDVEQEWRFMAGQLFGSGKIVPLEARRGRSIGFFARIAAAAAVLLLASVWIFQRLNQADHLEVATRNEVKEKLLPDGTQISLNQHSSVKYVPGKDGAYRRAELKGDAFFEVERDTARPFVVRAQNIEVEVLGTAFYVDAREGQPQIQVIVRSGSVAMAAGAEKITLTAGETGLYDKNSGELAKKQNEDANYLAWKTGVLVFENAGLESVVFDLNRKFHSRISIAGPELKACRLTATYDHKSLDAIIKIIEKTLNIKAEIKGEEIIFSGQGCG